MIRQATMTRSQFFAWVRRHTEGVGSVVEFGAGFFDRLQHVHPSVQNKIGIEIWQPYIDNAKYHDCTKIQGDILQFEILLPTDSRYGCALFIDVLEHLEKDAAIDLIRRVQARMDKILVMVPDGEHPQDRDVTGFGAHEYQTHRSVWRPHEIEALGFQDIHVDPTFFARTKPHLKDPGSMFAIWSAAAWRRRTYRKGAKAAGLTPASMREG